MAVTRKEFLRWAAISGAGLVGWRRGALGHAATVAGSAPPGAAASDECEGESRQLRRAVEAGDARRVEAALANDPALAYGRDERGRSLLVLACLAGHPEIAALLRRHLDPMGGGLDLVEATLVGDRERARELVRQYPGMVNEPHPFGGTAAHAAALAGRPEILMDLVVAGADFNRAEAGSPRRTPLRVAIEHPVRAVAEEMADTMLGNGALPGAPQGDGVTPLHAAAARGSREIVRLLVLDGADLAARAPDGSMPLDVALRHGEPATADLLRAAAAGRLPRRRRTSRLAYAASGAAFRLPEPPPLPPAMINQYVVLAHFDLAKVRELLRLCPALLLVNAPWDELAVEAGAHTGFKDGVQLQLDGGAPLSVPTAAMLGLGATVRRLLAEDPLRRWETGAHNMPLLWFPAIGGAKPPAGDHLEIAGLLLDRGIDPDDAKRGQTALHWAARSGQVEMVDLLLARGANVDARDLSHGREQTPLAQALAANQRATADRLRRHGGTMGA